MSKLDEVRDNAVRWEVEEALRTLTKAEEIKCDAELMKEVTKLADKQKKAISSIADLKKAYDKKVEEEDMPPKATKESEGGSYFDKVKKIKEEMDRPDAEVVTLQEPLEEEEDDGDE